MSRFQINVPLLFRFSGLSYLVQFYILLFSTLRPAGREASAATPPANECPALTMKIKIRAYKLNTRLTILNFIGLNLAR